MIPERRPDERIPRPALGTALALGRVRHRGRTWGPPARSLLASSAPVPLRRVLCSDRDVRFAEALAGELRRAGFDTRGCAGGPQALAEVKDFRPHACVLDLDAPEVAGCELARRVRSELGGLVFLVGLADRPGDALGRVAAGAGFDLLLSRPADAGLLAGLLAGPRGPQPG